MASQREERKGEKQAQAIRLRHQLFQCLPHAQAHGIQAFASSFVAVSTRRGKMIAFKEELFLLRKEPDVEIWYQDECGVSGDSRPRLVWSRKGKRPILPFTGAHFKDNVIGAVRPADGKFFSLIMPTSNTRSFQIFLDETQRHIQSRRAVMILDNASWHKPKMLDWGAYSRFTFLLTRLISIPSNASG